MKVQIIKTITKHLAVRLTDPELLAKADELAAVIEDITSEEGRQSDLKAQMKARLTELESHKQVVASIVRRHEELRDVFCDVQTRDGVTAQVVRQDTGYVVSERLLTDDEKQGVLPLAEPAEV